MTRHEPNTRTQIATPNLDKGKSILGAPPKVEKKETKNPRTKKDNNKKSQKKKPHFCHHCEDSWHTRPNCYKWLAIQHSNNVLSSGGQDQIPPSLGLLGDLLKALVLLLNLNGFNFSLSSPKQRCPSSKPKVWKEKGFKWFIHFISPLACISCCLFCFLIFESV